MTFVLQWWNTSGVSCGEKAVPVQMFLLLCNLRKRGNYLCRFNYCYPGLSARDTSAQCICFL